MSLQSQVAVVTGSSRGIGKAIALAIAEQGADVAIVYRNQKEHANKVKDQIESMGRRAVIIQADVTKPQDTTTLVSSVNKKLGPIDILVNNVGDFFLKPIAKMDPTEWDNVVRSNLHSVFYMCHAILPGMRERRKGRIINIGLSPTHMVRSAPNIAAYSISKTGVLILTRTLASEEAPYGITVNCLSPGLIDNGYLPPEQAKWMEKRVPMGRLGRPEEVANAVTFLVSKKASYISGANLSVSGAWDWDDRPTNHDNEVYDLFVGERS